MELLARPSNTNSFGQTGAETLDVEVPGVGGTVHAPTVNSHAPISGFVVLLTVPKISCVTCGTGVPRSLRPGAVGRRLPLSASTYSGLMALELSSCGVPACQVANGA